MNLSWVEKMTANETLKTLLFTIDGLMYAIQLAAVQRVIHAVSVRPLPKSPQIISGIINVHGKIIAVFDFRQILGLKQKKLDVNDRLIIADTGSRIIAIPVETVAGITEISPEDISDPDKILHYGEQLKGLIKLEGGIVLIYNIEKFINAKEEIELNNALHSFNK